jgi:hypothetical protein
VEEFTEQPDVVESSIEYKIAPLPEVNANAEGVRGDSGIVMAVVGVHDTVGVPLSTVNDCVCCAAAR